jgi:hypothetical protein
MVFVLRDPDASLEESFLPARDASALPASVEKELKVSNPPRL